MAQVHQGSWNAPAPGFRGLQAPSLRPRSPLGFPALPPACGLCVISSRDYTCAHACGLHSFYTSSLDCLVWEVCIINVCFVGYCESNFNRTCIFNLRKFTKGLLRRKTAHKPRTGHLCYCGGSRWERELPGGGTHSVRASSSHGALAKGHGSGQPPPEKPGPADALPLPRRGRAAPPHISPQAGVREPGEGRGLLTAPRRPEGSLKRRLVWGRGEEQHKVG